MCKYAVRSTTFIRCECNSANETTTKRSIDLDNREITASPSASAYIGTFIELCLVPALGYNLVSKISARRIITLTIMAILIN